MDAIEAVAIALAVLSGQEDHNRLRARARASMVVRSLNLAGFDIVPQQGSEVGNSAQAVVTAQFQKHDRAV